MSSPAARVIVPPPSESAHSGRDAGRLAAGVLWLVWAGLLFGGFLYGLATIDAADARQHIPRWCRMGSSLALVLAGLAGIVGTWGTPARRYAVLVALGMAWGLAGDLFNAGLLKWLAFAEQPVMGGILTFALGHIAYIAGGVGLARRAGLIDRTSWITAVAVWQLVALVGWFSVVYLAGDVGPIHWAALPYSMLLAGTAGVGLALAWQDRRFVPLAVGGALFLASDMILAFEMFRGDLTWAGNFVWLTYGPGQMLIVYSVWPALARLTGR